jgi:arylsulfatase
MILQWDESFDIGSDTLTGVNDADYQTPFPLTAKLDRAHRPPRPAWRRAMPTRRSLEAATKKASD